MTVILEALPGLDAWRLLLLLHKRAPQQMRASVALNESGARPSDLPALADTRWIEGLRDGQILDMTDQDNWAQGLSTVRLRLTPGGKCWVQQSPFNLILFAIYANSGATNRGVLLHELAATAAAEMSWFQRLAHAQMITLHHQSGEWMDPARHGAVIERNLREVVRMTQRGISLVTT